MEREVGDTVVSLPLPPATAHSHDSDSVELSLDTIAQSDTIALADSLIQSSSSTQSDSLNQFDTLGAPIVDFSVALDTARALPPPPRFVAVPSNKVRVLLAAQLTDTTLSSTGQLIVRDSRATEHRARGRFVLNRALRGGITIQHLPRGTIHCNLPCTLSLADTASFFTIGTASYRGALIIAAVTHGFNLVNYLPVEHYLRGVVPLELGHHPPAALEALKAQAVAARTYTYNKIASRRLQLYDVLPTVADQVYGGKGVEYALANLAIAQTRDRVLCYKGTLIAAYYHSTCGGQTANIEDVWDKSPQPYLRSVADRNGAGEAWCSASRYLNWEYRWSRPALEAIVQRYAASSARGPYQRPLSAIQIDSRFACGRVGTLVVHSSAGILQSGGDKVRFLLRRPTAGNPILPSARLSQVRLEGAEVVVSGQGYGHGVGMCQMGALGRARAGQGWEQILKAYYRGVDCATVVW
jgi:stage II sporulation protein D